MHKEVRHPCIRHKLGLLRDEATDYKRFRELATEITKLVCYEALTEVRTRTVKVKTPVAVANCETIDEEIVVVPILRAGVGMLDGILDLVPTARVGFAGMYRDEETKEPVWYYEKLPAKAKGGLCIVVDPMIATGGSAAATVDMVKRNGADRVIIVCIVTCPEGLEVMSKMHPDVDVFAAAIDDHLNEKKYIVPGLGDAGDRLFGTQ